MAISANGTQNGIFWETTVDPNDQTAPGILHAFDAQNLGAELWNSAMDPNDVMGSFAKFNNPTVVNGKVYVPTFSGTVAVYGLLSESATCSRLKRDASSAAVHWAHDPLHPIYAPVRACSGNVTFR
jgi:outer membrane protein assembly factor BamB